MASLIYTSCEDDAARGAIDFDTDTFKTLLVTSSYTPNQATHTRRSDITNEATGTGYTAGGATTACTVAKDTANKRITLTFAGPSWANATISAAGAVIYKSTGTASADPLVAYVDFGSTVTRTGATFSLSSTTITRQLS
jgi:hypothetical protein